MLRMLKTNPRRNPALRWTEGTSTARGEEGLKFERTDALRIPQITITHPRLGTGPAGTGLFQGYVERHTFTPRRGAPRVEYLARFYLLLPYSVAANPNNAQRLETARVGFSRSIMSVDPDFLHLTAERGLGEMYRVGDGEIAEEYSRAERNLVSIDDGSEFATLEEAKAWIQSKVDTLSRLTLERPSGY